MITQEEIKRLAELKEMASEYEKQYEAMKAREDAGEAVEAGGWSNNPEWRERKNVSWKGIVIRLEDRGILPKGYTKNVSGNTKPSRYMILKPAFSIAGEKSARKSA